LTLFFLARREFYNIGRGFSRKRGKIGGDEITSSRNPNSGFNVGDGRPIPALSDRRVSGRAPQRRQAAMAKVYVENLGAVGRRDHGHAR